LLHDPLYQCKRDGHIEGVSQAIHVPAQHLHHDAQMLSVCTRFLERLEQSQTVFRPVAVPCRTVRFDELEHVRLAGLSYEVLIRRICGEDFDCDVPHGIRFTSATRRISPTSKKEKTTETNSLPHPSKPHTRTIPPPKLPDDLQLAIVDG
jgi:hypothetical protein